MVIVHIVCAHRTVTVYFTEQDKLTQIILSLIMFALHHQIFSNAKESISVIYQMHIDQYQQNLFAWKENLLMFQKNDSKKGKSR